jgi:Domain of unknown function (DUF4440)
MKHCPKCNRTYNDESLNFCLEDGAPLVAASGRRAHSEQTLVSPSLSTGGSRSVLPPTEAYNQLPGGPTWSPSQSQSLPAPYLGATKQRKVWPWIVAVIAILLIGGVAAVVGIVLMPSVLHSSPNSNRVTPSPTPIASPSILPSPSPLTSPSNQESDVPTDSDQVLSDLSDLEDTWAEANVKGDKQTLERILADDYVGGAGKLRHNKREYIDNLTADPSIESWDTDNLQVQLSENRAILTGRLTEKTEQGKQTYNFTDTFVWRDHRWQAIASVSNRVE